MPNELGAGLGSGYPTSIDTDSPVETDGSTIARADVPNDLADAIIHIETELGENPSGDQATVLLRLGQSHNSYGAHDFSIVDSNGSHNANATTNEVINVITSAGTVTIPSAVLWPGRMYVIINATTNLRVTVTGVGGIGGQADRYMDRTGDTLWLISNGTEWSIISYVGLVW